MSETVSPDLVVLDARVYTADSGNGWADAFAVTDGKITAVGTSEEIAALAGPATQTHRLGGRFVMPGLCDAHAHIGLGGAITAWELSLLPSDSKQDILQKVRERASQLGPDEWIVGGIIGATVLDEVTYDIEALAELDEASGGRPVLLRDDSMHNRWVSSATLKLLGVDAATTDPEGGQYVRDTQGRHTGVLRELTSITAEELRLASIQDLDNHDRVSVATSIAQLNSFGITSVQDAGSMAYLFKALTSLEEAGELNAWVVNSMPARPFLDRGFTGPELYEAGKAARSRHVRPDFVKFMLDGVPMTRTTAMLSPYICHDHTEDPDFCGDLLWDTAELVENLRDITARGLSAKLHATGDRSVRQALDAIEQIRKERGDGPIFHIAHPVYVDPADVPRFAALNVIADASPYIWYPSVLQASIDQQIPAETTARSWPFKNLLKEGALVAAGSDWPAGLPSPDPWLGFETMVTRRNPDPSVSGALNESQALTIGQTIAAFTANAAQAMGLSEVTGRIKAGLSADFIVLDRDLFDVAVDQIHETAVLETWFEGRQVYQRDNNDAAASASV